MSLHRTVIEEIYRTRLQNARKLAAGTPEEQQRCRDEFDDALHHIQNLATIHREELDELTREMQARGQI